jgi:hypothetical protein
VDARALAFVILTFFGLLFSAFAKADDFRVLSRQESQIYGEQAHPELIAIAKRYVNILTIRDSTALTSYSPFL